MFEIGQEFEVYPAGIVDWCDANNCTIEEIEGSEPRRFSIAEIVDEPIDDEPDEVMELLNAVKEQDAAICALYEMIGA